MYGLDDEDSDETGTEPGTTDATESADSSQNQIISLFNKYYGGDTYGAKLEEARKKRESQLADYQKALEQSADVGGAEPSKSELYYRLSSALLEPGKTGDFWEGLGRAGKTLGEYEKEKRLARREKELGGLKIKTELQKLGIESTGDEISTLQALAAREMQDRTKLFGEIAKTMKPATAVSPAGKIAQDEGLTPGTPQFTSRVQEIEQDRASREQSRIDVLMARLGMAESAAADKRQALSQGEIKEIWNLENLIGAGDISLGLLQNALKYNESAFNLGNYADATAYELAKQRDPKNPKVVATGYLLNLLSRESLNQLKTIFGGSGITDAERDALNRLSGLKTASSQERALIIQTALDLVNKRLATNRTRMKNIYEGKYTRRAPSGEE